MYVVCIYMPIYLQVTTLCGGSPVSKGGNYRNKNRVDI